MDTVLRKYVLEAQDGSVYDVAKCFAYYFPSCKSFTDVEISQKLSEDLADIIYEIHEDVYKEATTSFSQVQCDMLMDICVRLSSVEHKLRTKINENDYITGIKQLYKKE